MSILQELIEMEMPNGDDNGGEKDYHDKEHASEHAKEFIDRAKGVLNYNKKPGDNEEVAKLAHQYAKDYYNSICDEINKMKYNGGEEKAPEMGADDMSPDMGM